MVSKDDVELMVRGGDWGVQLDVKSFPILCPACKKFHKELYEHRGSRYGQVGSVSCPCGETLYLTDSDNLVEYIDIHSETGNERLDFKELFHLTETDFNILFEKYEFDIYKEKANQRISLSDLVGEIEKRSGKIVKPIDSVMPLPDSVRKWIRLIKTEV